MDRRSEQRIQKLLACSLSIFSSEGELYATAVMTDLSENGVGVVTAVPIEPGTSLVVNFSGVLISAEVRNCSPDGKAFRIGLRAEQALATVDSILTASSTTEHIAHALEAEAAQVYA